MPAFFIISGYLFSVPQLHIYALSASAETPIGRLKRFIAFLRRIAKRCLFPYFFFVAIGAIIHLIHRQFFLFGCEMLRQIFITCMPDYTYTGAGWFLVSMFFLLIFGCMSGKSIL